MKKMQIFVLLLLSTVCARAMEAMKCQLPWVVAIPLEGKAYLEKLPDEKVAQTKYFPSSTRWFKEQRQDGHWVLSSYLDQAAIEARIAEKNREQSNQENKEQEEDPVVGQDFV